MIFLIKYTVAIVVILCVLQSCVCTLISKPNITGTVVCINRVEFYADGVRYVHDNDNNWNTASHINISGTTQVVAIKCTSVNDWNGISVVLSNGDRTDTTWKCSDGEEDGWNNVGFNDTAWRNAKLLPFWIWTSADISTASTGAIYCRKSMNYPISDLQIIGKAYCYDEMEFYADGERYTHQYDNSKYNPSPIRIPANTTVVAIRCKNNDLPPGLNVYLSNGDRTDTSWKCSDEEEEGWNTVSFDDTHWNNSKRLQVSNADYIWTSENPRQHGTVYCRKSLFFGTSTATTTNVGPFSPTTTVVELSTATITVMETCSPITTVVMLSIATTTVVEPCSPTTTVVQPRFPTTTSVELSTATTTVVEPCSVTTTVIVETRSPTTTVVEPCSPTTSVGVVSIASTTAMELCSQTTTLVELSTATTTVVDSCFSTTTVVETRSPTTSVVEPRSPITSVVEPCSITTTVIVSCTHTSDFDLQPSPTEVVMLGSDGVLRSQVCQDVVVVTSESAMREEAVTSIHKELTVDKSKMSSVIRKKVSQKDERPSSTAIGYFGLIFAILPLALIIMSDIPKLVKNLRTLIRAH